MRSRVALTVRYDPGTGEVTSQAVGPTFKDESLLLQADVLRDVVDVALTRYNATLAKLRAEWASQATHKAVS